ncbi:undecaprenyl-diphosphate phosphatase [Fictibacillus nanhaiensis]|uniref:undecaprenyl-diphosphate phosphatase n=1 Tax=Fictibacillus nanhaiensis TaxID=742169 RepID=UPI001C960518|nr:undecaprenyl-diphosphate phosphatase [Fictibacillus nanhaiensis]MBY6037690.1 undecaprenyl-diphosphate phosphatase [Fictibacillus nanhaiensis]
MDFKEFLIYVFLGMVQGFTEPIPISSSGHLVIVQHFMGIQVKDLNFEVLVNFASLLAVLLVYKEDLYKLVKNTFSFLLTRKKEYKTDFLFSVYLILATIPVAVLGILFEDLIGTKLKGIQQVGFALLATAVALYLIRNLKGYKGDKRLTVKDAVVVGFAQAVALIPGISRSGATIVACMALGMKQDTALRFSFFLYIPVSLGTFIMSAGDLASADNFRTMLLPYIGAFIASLVFSYFSLKWFMGIMKRGNLGYFALYCLLAGVFIVFYF